MERFLKGNNNTPRRILEVSKMTTSNTIPRISKRAIGLILFVQVLVFAVFIAPLNVSAAYSRDGNNLNPNYSLTGNGASDIVAVAKAQLGKKYRDFSGFHYRAWCADFVSACAAAANQSDAIPGNASVSGIRSSIKKAGGVEYSKSTIQNGKYVPKRGDIIIFKSSGDSHVGIVDYTSGSNIYYIDGNNTSYGNGNNACVHYSNKTFNYKRFTCVISPNYKNQNPARDTYNDVFASTKGSGYSLNQAKAYASSTFTKGQFVYVWGYLHDVNNNLYKSYGSGTCNQIISIYRPDGTCAHTYTYKNSDNNWIGQKLDKPGTWKIRSKVSGALSGTNTQTITVKDPARKTYNDVFASTKGSGYGLNQAKAYASSTFTKGQFVYVWGYLHDVNNNLYKSYGSGTCNQTISIYRPDGTCAHTYTYKNSDNNWIGQKLDKPGTWKIRSKVSGTLSGTNTQTITVK